MSSLAALAGASTSAWRMPLIEAGRGEVFAALYEGERRAHAPRSRRPRTSVARRVAEAGADPLAAGDGSVRFRDVLEAAGVRVEPAGSVAHVVRGLAVCRLARRRLPCAPPEAVLPDYQRLPDAKPRT